MIESIDTSLIDWSRAQFAMTAMYHWIFVPLTLGLAVVMGIMETLYYKTGNEFWKKTAQFWMKLFGINFAIGVATGLILEFEFGTNWSNYSWFVGDIFGAPLAIEGILAFFMEATFIAVMFFGWGKVSKRFHLASTWLTGLGATISAWWILVANAWMQHPVGMEFNPDTVRNEMVDFWAVATSPVAVNKFFHTVLSGWVLGGVFVVGISCWYLLKKRNREFALASIKIGAIFGLVASLLAAWTGDGSGYQIAQTQPMKLAAVEGLYEGGTNVGLVGIGVLNPEKETYDDGKEPFLFRFEIPSLLSFLAERDADGYVPGITNIIEGGYQMKDGTTALSAAEKIERGKTAIGALAAYRAAKSAGHEEDAQVAYKVLQENIPYFGYGYIKDVNQLAPSYLLNLKMQAANALATGISWTVFMIPATIILAAGSMFILWLGERITDKGVGNGISLIIMIGIIARLPQAFVQEMTSRLQAISGGGLIMFIVEILILYAVVCASILLVQGTRKIPVQYAKRLVGNKQYGGARQYIPLKLFAANVMPIIFAQALMFIPLAVVRYQSENASSVVQQLMDNRSLLYNVIYVILVIAFTYFYTAITLNPTQMAEDMKRNNGFIPGVKPGKDTAEYIDTVMSRITLPGSLFIAFIAIMPALAGLLDVQQAFSQFFGGTSLLILVGVVIDTLQQIESHLLMRHYDGLLNSGHTRQGGVAAY